MFISLEAAAPSESAAVLPRRGPAEGRALNLVATMRQHGRGLAQEQAQGETARPVRAQIGEPGRPNQECRGRAFMSTSVAAQSAERSPAGVRRDTGRCPRVW